jgi:hypothetical protein
MASMVPWTPGALDAGHRGNRVLRAGRQGLDFSRNESGGLRFGSRPGPGADRRSSLEGLMAEKSHGTWYVSVDRHGKTKACQG